MRLEGRGYQMTNMKKKKRRNDLHILHIEVLSGPNVLAAAGTRGS